MKFSWFSQNHSVMQKYSKEFWIVLACAIVLAACVVFILGPKTDTNAIQGNWASYPDCPNTTFTFQSDMNVKMESCDGEYRETVNETAKYEIIANKARAQFSKQTFEFEVEYVENEPKLNVTSEGKSYLFFKF